MIPIIQVYRYQTNNGCSVRIGWGITHEELLDSGHCIYFDFVESPPEVKAVILLIEKLSKRWRNKEHALQTLHEYLISMNKSSKMLTNMFTVKDNFRKKWPRVGKRN